MADKGSDFAVMTGRFFSKRFSRRKPILAKKRKKSKEQSDKDAALSRPAPTTTRPRPPSPDVALDHVNHNDNHYVNTECDGDIDYVNVKLSYLQAIHVNNAISFYGVLPDLAVLQDFSLDSLKLKINRHVIIKRRAVKFTDGAQWLFACSCMPTSTQLVPTLNDNILQTYNDFMKQKLLPSCIHVEVVKDVIMKFDSINDVSVEDGLTCLDNEHTYAAQTVENIIGTLPLPAVIIHQNKLYGVVMVWKKNLWCSTCVSSFCAHVTYMKKLKMTEGGEDIAPEVNAVFFQMEKHSLSQNRGTTCLSEHPIPFQRDADLSCKILHLEAKLSLSSTLLQPVSRCNNCFSTDGQYSTPIRCPVVTSTSVYTINVTTWTCQLCQHTMTYDGFEDGVLNMKKYLVSHEMLRSYLHGFLHGKRTLAAFFHELKQRHLDYGHLDFDNYFSYTKLKESWYCYLNLLDVQYKVGFCCTLCGSTPDTIVCDGTTLAFRKQMLKAELPGVFQEEALDGCSFKELVFIKDANTRKLLRAYSKGRSMTETDFAHLIDLLTKESQEISHFVNGSYSGTYVIKPHYKHLLHSLSSMSPISSFLPPDDLLIDILRRVLNGEDISCYPQDWSSFQKQCPVLFNFLLEEFPLSRTITDLLQILVDKSLSAFYDKVNQPDGTVASTSSISCFPSLPEIRSRGFYIADQKTGKGERCKKIFSGHPSLLPGIFTLFCQHGVCYGFQVMANHESPNIPFTIFRTRFKTAPKMIIYDFACALHKYCLRRDPVFFKNTRFYVDRFHWHNHKGCSMGYCLDLYSQFSDLNSQVNEQGNSSLKRIKDQLSYMTEKNFMVHCKLFLYNRNLLKLPQLSQK